MNLAWMRLLQLVRDTANDGGAGGGGTDPVSSSHDDDDDGDEADGLDEPGDPAKKLKEWQQYARRLRKENKRRRETMTTLKSQNDELQAKLQRDIDAAKAAAKTEADERVKSETTNLSKTLTERIIRAELKAEAAKAGIVDFDGLKLLDVSSIKLNDAGDVEGAADIIAKLKEDKPYLFGAASSTATTTSTSKAPDPDTKPKSVKDMTPEEYEAAKSALLKSPVRRRA